MSSVSDAADPGSEAATTSARSRVGRLRLIAGAAVLAAAVAYVAAGQPWYTMSVSGVVVVDESYSYHHDVSAHGAITGRQLVAQSDEVTMAAPGAVVVNNQVPSGVAGVPTGVFFALAAAALIVAGAALRSALLSAAAFAAVALGFRALSALVRLVEDPAAGGGFVTPAAGLSTTKMALVALGVLALSGTAMVVSVNAQARRIRREAALAAGKTPAPTMIEWVRAIGLAGAARIAEAGEAAKQTAK